MAERTEKNSEPGRQMKWVRQKSFRRWMTVVAAAILLFVALGGLWLFSIQREVRAQNEALLEEVTHQYAAAVIKELRSKGNLLRGVGDSISSDPEQIRREMEALGALSGLYKFQEAGFITQDGTAYCGDSAAYDVSGEDFWQEISQDTVVFYGVTEDHVFEEREKVNLITAPARGTDGTLKGYLFAVYPAAMFQDLFSIDAFDGAGKSYLFRMDGDVLTSSDPDAGGNVFEAMEASGSNQGINARMQEDFQEGKSGLGTYLTKTGEERQIYYMPVSVMDGQVTLYVATSVPMQAMEERSASLMELAQLLLVPLLIVTLIFVLYGVAAYRKYQKELLRFASTDDLTGGDNYNAFRLNMRQWKRQGYIVSVDLEDFKRINAVCGVQRGDLLLKEMWQVLQALLSPEDMGCRVGGDQYAVFLHTGDLEAVLGWVETCCARLEELAGKLDLPRLTPKFGVCRVEETDDLEESYGRAKQAKKTVAGRRDRCYGIYDEGLQRKLDRDKALVDGFESGLTHREFQVWYQPKYVPASGAMTGAEALVRWQTAEGEIISPGVFVPLFERSGLVVRLDEYVFRAVCQAQRRWKDEGRTVHPVSVNLSRASLYTTDIVARYLAVAQAAGVPLSMVPLEITESIMVNEHLAQEQITRFREAGFSIQIDDFGQGFSALSTLRMGCFDTLKIDKSLIDGIGDPRGETLLWHVVELAHGLGLSVTAEGVEHLAQVDKLVELGCDAVQGFYYSQAKSQQDFEEMLR